MNFEIFLLVLVVVLVIIYFYQGKENFSSKLVCGVNYHSKNDIVRCPPTCPKPVKINGGTECIEIKKANEVMGVCGDNKHSNLIEIKCPLECGYKKTYPGGTICNTTLPPLTPK